jgi:hypothetical protein
MAQGCGGPGCHPPQALRLLQDVAPVLIAGSGEWLLLRTADIVQCSSPLDRVLDCP